MRLLTLLVLFVGCSKNSLKHDVEVFCAADFEKPLSEIGPKLEQQVTSDEFKEMVARLKAGTISPSDTAPWLDAAAKKAGIDKCPALEKLSKR